MKFKAAAGSTVCQSHEDVKGIKLVVEVNCPKCGVNVEASCLIQLNAKQKVEYGANLDGYGLVTPCCHMSVRGRGHGVRHQ